MNQLYDRYQKPLFLVENGLGAHDTVEPTAVSTMITASTTCAVTSRRSSRLCPTAWT